MASVDAWSTAENKAFEVALLQFAEEEPCRYCFPEKSPDDVAASLLHDVCLIESAGVKLPTRLRSASGGKRAKIERKKAKLWTIEEHYQFLIGLQRYGRGDWRSISRDCVKTRTPAQIASHAQKYFKRLELHDKERKRCSIHDIRIPQMSNAHDLSRAADCSSVQQVPATTHHVHMSMAASTVQYIPASASTVEQHILVGASSVAQRPVMSTDDYNSTVVSTVQHIPVSASTVEQHILVGASSVPQRDVMSIDDYNSTVVSYPSFNFQEWESQEWKSYL